MTHAPYPAHANPIAVATFGHQMILDTLRAEMAALQAILPGVATEHPAAQQADEPTDAGFDNMPV